MAATRLRRGECTRPTAQQPDEEGGLRPSSNLTQQAPNSSCFVKNKGKDRNTGNRYPCTAWTLGGELADDETSEERKPNTAMTPLATPKSSTLALQTVKNQGITLGLDSGTESRLNVVLDRLECGTVRHKRHISSPELKPSPPLNLRHTT